MTNVYEDSVIFRILYDMLDFTSTHGRMRGELQEEFGQGDDNN